MPGNTWKDLRRNANPPSSTPRGGQPGAITAAQNPDQQATVLERAKQVSPRLASLLDKRKTLENRLRSLTSGTETELDPRDAARFRVPTFAERREQQRNWETQRDQLRRRAADIRNFSADTASLQRGGLSNNRTSSPLDSVNQWLNRRDTQRQRLREAARDRLSPLNDVARVGRQLGNSLSSTSQQLKNLDRQLADKGLTQEREELNKLGGGRLSQIQSGVSKYTKMAEAPMRAVDKIGSSWDRRRQQISGAMDRTSSYADRSRRRLSTRTGGSGDLFERMERNRRRALQQRAEKRREEARDEARRKRARRAKNDKNKDNKGKK